MTDPVNCDADDPSHGNLLDFDPVPRKVKRPDGWTPELQREFIRRLAETGSPQQACVDMDKKLTGIEALYKVPTADSFRAAWHRAVQIGRTAQGLDGSPPHLGPVPGIRRRPARGQLPSRLRDRSAQPVRGTGEHWKPLALRAPCQLLCEHG